MTPSRTGAMDAPRAAFGAGLAGPLLLDTYKQLLQTRFWPSLGPVRQGQNARERGV